MSESEPRPQQPKSDRLPYPVQPIRDSLTDFILIVSIPTGAGLVTFGGVLTPPDYRIVGAGAAIFTVSLVRALRQHRG